MAISQLGIIKNHLEIYGQVNNVNAIKGIYGGRVMLRLGAIIHELRHEYEMNIETVYKNEVGHRNTIYKYHAPKEQKSLF
ncbi:MAG: hypothetical protein KAS32_00260 [Candidatus Peribacteraceae bacterium]|nr:hypothetical protein [Candidatus Peribacteraceae bacterium]